jgi:hypothetical protein
MIRRRRRGPTRQPERALHTEVAYELDTRLPADAYWFPVPNASKRGVRQAAAMKAAGEIKAGVPDLFIIWRGRPNGVELKVDKNVLTKSQKDAHIALTLAGAVVITVRSLAELLDFLAVLQIPLRPPHDSKSARFHRYGAPAARGAFRPA